MSVGLFAGKVDFETLSPFFRMTLSKSDESPEGDWRDWDAIDQWASDFAAQLQCISAQQN